MGLNFSDFFCCSIQIPQTNCCNTVSLSVAQNTAPIADSTTQLEKFGTNSETRKQTCIVSLHLTRYHYIAHTFLRNTLLFAELSCSEWNPIVSRTPKQLAALLLVESATQLC